MTPTTDELPVPVGTSPFHVRGLVYRSFLTWLDSVEPGFCQRAVEELTDPDLRRWFELSFSKDGWYDVFPLIPLTHVAARLRGIEFAEFCRLRSRLQALEDIQGAYKLFLKVASPAMVALKLPRLAGRYFNFGKDDATRVEPACVRIHRSGLPRYLADWFVASSGSFIVTALECAGAREPSANVVSITSRGDGDGVEMVDVVFDIRWKA